MPYCDFCGENEAIAVCLECGKFICHLCGCDCGGEVVIYGEAEEGEGGD